MEENQLKKYNIRSRPELQLRDDPSIKFFEIVIDGKPRIISESSLEHFLNGRRNNNNQKV